MLSMNLSVFEPQLGFSLGYSMLGTACEIYSCGGIEEPL